MAKFLVIGNGTSRKKIDDLRKYIEDHNYNYSIGCNNIWKDVRPTNIVMWDANPMKALISENYSFYEFNISAFIIPQPLERQNLKANSGTYAFRYVLKNLDDLLRIYCWKDGTDKENIEIDFLGIDCFLEDEDQRGTQCYTYNNQQIPDQTGPYESNKRVQTFSDLVQEFEKTFGDKKVTFNILADSEIVVTKHFKSKPIFHVDAEKKKVDTGSIAPAPKIEEFKLGDVVKRENLYGELKNPYNIYNVALQEYKLRMNKEYSDFVLKHNPAQLPVYDRGIIPGGKNLKYEANDIVYVHKNR